MSGCTGSNFANPEDLNLPPPTPSSSMPHGGMSEDQTPINLEPIAAVPLAALCPPSYGFRQFHFSSIHEEYLAEQEGVQRMAEVAEADQKQKRAAPGTRASKSKAIEQDGVRGSWFPCKPDEAPIKLLVDEGFLKRDLIHYTPDEAAPVPPSGFRFRRPNFSWTCWSCISCSPTTSAPTATLSWPTSKP